MYIIFEFFKRKGKIFDSYFFKIDVYERKRKIVNTQFYLAVC